MKKYILLVLIVFSFSQAFAQKDDLTELYKIPEGQVLKFYQDDGNTKVYFFNPVGFDKASLTYFRYLAMKDPRVVSIKNNAGTRVISIQITNDFEFEKFKNHVIFAKKEISYLLANYDDHIAEMERLIYEGN